MGGWGFGRQACEGKKGGGGGGWLLATGGRPGDEHRLKYGLVGPIGPAYSLAPALITISQSFTDPKRHAGTLQAQKHSTQCYFLDFRACLCHGRHAALCSRIPRPLPSSWPLIRDGIMPIMLLSAVMCDHIQTQSAQLWSADHESAGHDREIWNACPSCPVDERLWKAWSPCVAAQLQRLLVIACQFVACCFHAGFLWLRHQSSCRDNFNCHHSKDVVCINVNWSCNALYRES